MPRRAIQNSDCRPVYSYLAASPLLSGPAQNWALSFPPKVQHRKDVAYVTLQLFDFSPTDYLNGQFYYAIEISWIIQSNKSIEACLPISNLRRKACKNKNVKTLAFPK